MMLDMLTLAAENPVNHVVPHAFPGAVDGDFWWWSSICTNLVLSAIIVIVGGLIAAKSIETGDESEGNDRFITRNPFSGVVEVIAVYLRDSVVRPLLHERTDKMMPFLWTLFFFILVNNLLGLIPLIDLVHLAVPKWKEYHVAPIGGTATQSLAVTGVLALIAGVVFNVAAIKELGFKGYFGHMTGGVPLKPAFLPIAIMVFFIELAGQIFIKPVALAIRLFANMTAGHILLATIFMFTGMGFNGGFAVGGPVLVVSFLGSLAITFLEIFVAFLQAFVFMFLTAVFISLMSHHGDDHDHAHGHEDADYDLTHAPSVA